MCACKGLPILCAYEHVCMSICLSDLGPSLLALVPSRTARTLRSSFTGSRSIVGSLAARPYIFLNDLPSNHGPNTQVSCSALRGAAAGISARLACALGSCGQTGWPSSMDFRGARPALRSLPRLSQASASGLRQLLPASLAPLLPE